VLFRILTYNIHKCVGGVDRRHDPERIAEAIAHYRPDIAMLQEVESPHGRGARAEQAHLLGERLGYRHRAYFPHVIRRGGGQYGNAVLSRYPILETNHIDLTIPLKKKRGALHARIRAYAPSGRARTLHVYNLHLGLSGIERKLQLRRFLNSHPFARLHVRAPIIVGGDFNDVWGTLGRKVLAPAGFRGMTQKLSTFPAFAPMRALDAFYVRGSILIAHAQRGQARVCRQASDHLPVIADMILD